MKSIDNFFMNLAETITSINAVLTILIVVILSLTMCSHALFNNVLPHTLTGWERQLASWMLAIGWESTLLTVSCNAQHLGKRLPIIVAVSSGIIVLFFIEAFEFNMPFLESVQRWFIGGLISLINYLFTELFQKVYSERKKVRNFENEILALSSKSETDQQTIYAKTKELADAKKDFDELFNYVAELEEFKAKKIKELTCQCGKVYESIFVLNAHKSKCDKAVNQVNLKTASTRSV